MGQLVRSPRWILWTLLTLVAMATCTGLGVWQWQRAGSAMGSALNIGYGLQWPLFAVFFAVMWWRMLRLQLAERSGDGGHVDGGHVDDPDGVAAAVPGEASPFDPRPAGVATAPTRPLGLGRAPSVSRPAVRREPSPFGPRPAGVATAPTRPVDFEGSSPFVSRPAVPDRPPPPGARPAAGTPRPAAGDPEPDGHNRMPAEPAGAATPDE